MTIALLCDIGKISGLAGLWLDNTMAQAAMTRNLLIIK